MSRKSYNFIFDLKSLYFIFIGGFLLALNVIISFSLGCFLERDNSSFDCSRTIQNMSLISWIIGHIVLAFAMKSEKKVLWNLELLKYASICTIFLVLTYLIYPLRSFLFLELMPWKINLIAVCMPFSINLIYEMVKYLANFKRSCY